MANYAYTAKNDSEKIVRGNVESDSKESAIELVKKQGLSVITISESKKAGFLNMSIGGKVKTKDLVIFTRQLATLVNAGVPLVRSLSTLQMQSEN